MPLTLRLLASLTLTCGFALSGCGGGGSQNSSSNPIQWQATQEYTRNYGLALIEANALYANGASGESVIVAVIDSGIDANHNEFTGRISAASYDIVNNSSNITDDNGHGTFVAGIIAANFGSGNVHGVAYNAEILAIDATSNDGFFYDNNTAAAIRYAVDNHAQVINMSLGGFGNSLTINSALQYAADNGVAVVIATGNHSCRSNPTGSGCSYGAVAPISEPAQEAGNPTYTGHIIAVGATDENGNVSDYSSSCAAYDTAFCLVAPGDNIYSTLPGSNYGTGSGTSFATPHVAGAIALLKDAFPNLTMAQAVQIVLASATDRGATSPSFSDYDSNYGNGLLNIAAAMGPAGSLSTSVNGNIITENTQMNLSAAMGDSLSREYAFANMVLYDNYQRAYRSDITKYINNSSTNNVFLANFTDIDASDDLQIASSTFGNLTTSLSYKPVIEETFQNPLNENISFNASYDIANKGRVGFSTGSGNHTVSGFDFASQTKDEFLLTDHALTPLGFLTSNGQGISLSQRYKEWNLSYGLSSANLENSENFAAEVKIDRRFVNGLSLGISGSLVMENGGFLGTTGTGAFNSDYNGQTLGFTAGAGYQHKNLTLYGQFTSAYTNVKTTELALLTDFSRLRAQSLSAGMRLRNIVTPRDNLSITIAKPLRVVSGHATLNGEVADSGKTSTTTDTRVDFTPSGSQTNIELGYHSVTKSGASWGVGLAYVINPNHDSTIADQIAFGARYLISF